MDDTTLRQRPPHRQQPTRDDLVPRELREQTATLGVSAALTAAIAHAQLAETHADIVDRLLALKRDVMLPQYRGNTGGRAA